MSMYISDMEWGRAGFSRPSGQNATQVVVGGILDPSKLPATWGAPVKYSAVTKSYQKLEAGDTVDKFYGVLIEKFSQEPVALNDYNTPNSREIHSIARCGTRMLVKCWVGTPVNGAAVYVDPTTNRFEADPSASNFRVPHVTWVRDGKDANSIAEIYIK